MEKAVLNRNLSSAKKSKNDEYYTQLADIERELKYYKHHFKGKVVYCNCDDPRISNFFHYFSYNFKKLGLKKLITTCYKSINPELFSRHDSERAIYLEYDGDKNGNNVPDIEEIGIVNLKSDGDFRSKESIELLKQADIVVTNPPFSLFREYVAQLMEYDKKFLIIGNVNAISYKECFKFIKENKMWLGYNCIRHFQQPDGSMFETARTYWYTNLDIAKRHEDIILYKTYYGNEDEYPEYDNYNAINVDKTSSIPIDYDGAMGVPITFMEKYNPDQFEIISSNDIRKTEDVPFKEHGLVKDKEGSINGKPTYVRVIIRKRK
ncbi:MAG: adenine-specific methyltransferase EcoRI family protein [Bacteroidetes bacterium]|nr:adenine-specific methyltransferase EcoRI family protein [Bacteroidota bacterium]